MEVRCPQCGTQNESVDLHLRDPDHLMKCIRCGFQFRLTNQADQQIQDDFDDDLTGVDMDALDPRARSVRIPLDQVNWSSMEDALGGPSVSLGPALDSARRGRASMSMPAASATPTPADSSNPTGQETSTSQHQDRWTWRDLPLAFAAVFDWRRFLVAAVGLWVSLIVHGLIQWFAIWAGTRNTGLGTLFSLIAAAILMASCILVCSVCSVMCQTDLIEERPVSFEDAVQWTKNWMQSVLGTPLAFVAVVASVVIIQALLGFVGRVPVLGAPLWGLFTPITLVTSLIGGLAVVALAYSLPIYIPLIYTERTTPLDTLTRLLELLREQGVRIIGSLFGMMALTAAATAVVLYPAWMIAVDLATRVGTATMGPSLGQSAAHVPDSFTPWMVFFLKSPGHVGTTTTDGGQVAAGAIMGVMVTVGPAIFFGALALVLCASGCIIYSMATGRRKE